MLKLTMKLTNKRNNKKEELRIFLKVKPKMIF